MRAAAREHDFSKPKGSAAPPALLPGAAAIESRHQLLALCFGRRGFDFTGEDLMRLFILAFLVVLTVCGVMPRANAAESVDDLLKAAREALDTGQTKEALDLANKAVAQDGKSFRAYRFRGGLNEQLQKHKE